MKKFKLLPSLIMLVLCIGVLAVGVYALTPISNSIAGTISISAGKASIAITGYIDNTEVYPRTELHEGMEWAIASSNLNFNASNYFFPEDVPSKVIRLKIENLSSVPYGVFFCDHADVNATASNIKTTGEIKSTSDSSKTIVNASMDYYKYISSTDSNSTLDQVDMTITLSVASLTASAQTGKFTYYLNIEEYNSSLNTTEEFVKVDDSLTTIDASAYADNTSIKNVIIPSTITSIGANAFSGCTGLTKITIPPSVITIGAGAFNGCSNLQKIIVGTHAEAGDFGGSASLPTANDKSWYLNGVYLSTPVLSYGTEEFVFVWGDKYVQSKVLITVTATASSMHDGTDVKPVVSGGGEYSIGETVTFTFSATVPSQKLATFHVALRAYNSDGDILDNVMVFDVEETSVEYSFTLEEDSYTIYGFVYECADSL